MKKEVALKWAAALESGKYPQGFNTLHRTDGTYCCLGVLCELYQEEVGGLRIESPVMSRLVYYDGEATGPPLKVMEWIDMADDEMEEYIHMNDQLGWSFNKIAASIRDEIMKE